MAKNMQMELHATEACAMGIEIVVSRIADNATYSGYEVDLEKSSSRIGAG